MDDPMCKPSENLMLEKKVTKKLIRGLKLINKDLNANLKLLFPSCDIVSKNVVIVNGGLTTGLDETSLICLLADAGFSTIEKIAIIPHKQYCFVCFSNTVEASRAVRNLSGKIKLSCNANYPLYLGCVNEVPVLKNNTVFDYPPGLKVFEEFITRDEEIFLSNLINWENCPSASSEGSTLKHRQVHHFGYEFKYGSNSIDRSSPLEQGIPEELQSLCQRFVDNSLISKVPDQLTVNRYFPGQGIPPHVDTHQSFTGEILSLSILGGVVMDFFCHLDHCSVNNEYNDDENPILHYAVYLPRRSLCAMSGSSRYQWTHGICSRKTDVYPDPATKYLTLQPRQERISFTFRKLKEDGLCKCSFPKMCDSQFFKKDEHHERLDEHLKDISAMKLEREHVLEVYENIADHFSETRHKAWPKVAEFVESLPVGSILLDVGCGNGKYLTNDHQTFQIGCDTSSNLLAICAGRKIEVALSNCLSLPFKGSSFDAVICIAVIHHLASENRRRESLGEMVRVLRDGGRALVYVWAMEQKRDKLSTYLKQKRSNRREFQSLQSNGQLENKTQLLDNRLSRADKTSRNEANLPNGEKYSMENGQVEKGFQNLCESPAVDNNITKSFLIHQNRTEFVDQDMFVPWKIKPKKFQKTKDNINSVNVSLDTMPTFHRYYHVFKEGELQSLFKELPNIKIIKSYYDEGNWCIIVEKTNEGFAESETNGSLTGGKICEVDKTEEVDSKPVDYTNQLLLLHDIEEKAEQLANFIVSVSFNGQRIKPKDDVEETLLWCTNAMISEHKDVFLELVSKLKISNETAYISFQTVLNELFEGNKTVISWGRIVALYAFGGQLALYCKENNLPGLQKMIPNFIGRFAKKVISHFVLEEGGWHKLCEIYPRTNIDNQIWSIFLWTTVGLCLAIIVSSMFSR